MFKNKHNYTFVAKQADEHNHWWTMFKIVSIRNKSLGTFHKSGEEDVRQVAEYSLSVATLRKRKDGKWAKGFGWGFKIERGATEEDLLISLYFGPFLSLWLHLSNRWLNKLCSITKEKDPKHWYEGRQYRLVFFDGIHAMSFDWATPTMSWSKDNPGFSWDTGKLKRKIFGFSHYEHKILEENIEVLVDMPEGLYKGVCKKEITTWYYTKPIGKLINKLFPSKPHLGWQIDIDGGIPFEGKGENSYDCGMDGLFSMSTGEDILSYTQLAESTRSTVLNNRKKYGGPFNLPRAMSVKEAEEWQVKSRG